MGQDFVGKILPREKLSEDFFADFGFLDKKPGGSSSSSGQKDNGTASTPQAETRKIASKKIQPAQHLSQV